MVRSQPDVAIAASSSSRSYPPRVARGPRGAAGDGAAVARAVGGGGRRRAGGHYL